MTRFFHIASAVTFATTMLVASPASAAAFLIDIGPGASSADFGNTGSTSGPIADTFTFTVPAGSANGFVGSIALTPALDITLTSVFLDDRPFSKVLSDGIELFTLSATQVASGPHTIFVNGTWGSAGGSYAGTLNFTPGLVPEPATWAMLIGGIGAVGTSLRRRKAKITVRYA